MMLLNRLSRVLFVLCIGVPLLVQAGGIHPALKLKIINNSDKQITVVFVHHKPDIDTEKNIKSGGNFFTKLDPNKLRAICTHKPAHRRTMMTGWYNRAVDDARDHCLEISPLLQQREHKKLLEVTYKKEHCHPEATWKL